MSETITERLAAMGIDLPEAAPPAASYAPYMRAGDMLYISGQLPIVDGKVAFIGHLGRQVDVETGKRAAAACAINILSQISAALDGDLERIVTLIKIQGFVASAPDFTKHHLVVNGASELLAEVLGERGQHARAAVGMAALPLNAAVEIDAVVEIR